MNDKQPQDWERIEQLYRAGVLSVREIASTCTVSHVSIHKRAKRDGWSRDLAGKIKAKADALVNNQVVNAEVNKERALTEKGIVDANAQVIADIRIAHRTDIGRSRKLAIKLLEELESLTDNRDLFEQLGDLLRSEDEKGQDRRNDLYLKVIDLPNRTKTMKDLSETLKTLVTLERQAFNLDEVDGGKASPADPSNQKIDSSLIGALVSKLVD